MKQMLKKLFTLNFEEWKTLFNETMYNHQFGETEAIILIIAIIIVAIFVYKKFLTACNEAYSKAALKVIDHANFAFAPFTWWIRWMIFIIMLVLPLAIAILLVMFIDINVFALIG